MKVIKLIKIIKKAGRGRCADFLQLCPMTTGADNDGEKRRV